MNLHLCIILHNFTPVVGRSTGYIADNIIGYNIKCMPTIHPTSELGVATNCSLLTKKDVQIVESDFSKFSK